MLNLKQTKFKGFTVCLYIYSTVCTMTWPCKFMYKVLPCNKIIFYAFLNFLLISY